jgi:cytochrome P450
MERALRRYGDPFTVTLQGVGDFVFVTDPAAIKQIFTADPEKLRSGKANVALEPVLGSRSVLLLDGREHLRQRKLMLPPFHGERLRRYEELMGEIAAEEVDGWPKGEPIALQPRMQAITLEIILRVVFGYERGAQLTELRDRVVRLLETSASPMALYPPLRRDLGPWSPWTRFLRAREQLDEALFEEIGRRRGDDRLADRDDIFSMLVQARDEDGEPLTDRELRDELVTLLIAGHETTATALSWAFERLMRLPGSLERLADDEYAEAAVTETLRLRPPLPVVARFLEEPYELLGWEAARRLPGPLRVPPRAVHRHGARHLRVAALRRRHPALHRGELRLARDARGAPDRGRAGAARGPGAGARAREPQGDHPCPVARRPGAREQLVPGEVRHYVEPVLEADGAQDPARHAVAGHDREAPARLARAAVGVDDHREAGGVDEADAAKIDDHAGRLVALDLEEARLHRPGARDVELPRQLEMDAVAALGGLALDAHAGPTLTERAYPTP